MAGKNSRRWMNFDGLAPVMAFLSELPSGEGPWLDEWLHAMTTQIWDLAGVEVVLLTVSGERAAKLDGFWQRSGTQRLAVWPGSGSAHWIEGPQQTAQTGLPPRSASSDSGRIQRFAAPAWEGEGWPWDDSAAGHRDSCSWWRALIRVEGEDLLEILLQVGERPGSKRRAVQALTLLQLVLEPWLADRVETMRLRLDSDRLAAENLTYSRLNLLQRRFTAMTSHEFKTPLTSITAYSDALLAHGQDPGFAHTDEFLGVIRAEAGRLLRLVDRFLDYAKADYGLQLLERRTLELSPLVTATVAALKPVAEAKNQQVEIFVAEQLPRAEIDPDLIRQVLVNLLGNAIKYTPDRGRIAIRIDEAESCLAVRVEDNGPGIPAQDIRRVFRDFYRSSGTQEQEGTGLGLSIARNILDLHGGHIEVMRRAEGGTTFRFLVPKELTCSVPLPKGLIGQVDPGEATRLVRVVVRLLAEMTGSHSVALIVPDDLGGWSVAGALGSGLGARDAVLAEVTAAHAELAVGRSVPLQSGTRLLIPLGRSEAWLGCVMLGSKRPDPFYGPHDLRLIEILAEVARLTLLQMAPAPAAAGKSAEPHSVAKVVEAVRVLLQSRRRGVPTSSVQALHLLDRMANRLGLNEEVGRRLRFAAVLHDAGMARVEDEIVMGASPLTFDERDEVDCHVDQSVELMAPLMLQPGLAEIIRHHHERFDGSGFPAGQAGREIPLGSRILAIIDAWSALTTDRTFRQGMAPEAALAEIQAHAGTQFDPELVQVFTEVLRLESISTESPVPAGPDRRGDC